MSLERIYNALVSLGLSLTEARLYIFLALNGPKEARSIVNEFEIDKQRIIRGLENLRNKGIVIAILDKKTTFSALPFEEALDLLIEIEKEQAKSLQESREELISSWQTNKREKSENN